MTGYNFKKSNGKKTAIVFVKVPQTMLLDREGKVYTNRRAYNPDPTLPLLKALTEKACRELGIQAKAFELDLRDDRLGNFGKIRIGEMKVDYIGEPLEKAVFGINVSKPGKARELLEKADILGFSSNFAANANSVAYYMGKAREINPGCEIWAGGTDASIKDRWHFYFSKGADIIFRGDVFETLKPFLKYRFKGKGIPVNIVTRKGESEFNPGIHRHGTEYFPPVPAIADNETLCKFSECAEGPYPGKQEDFLPSVYVQFTRGCTGNCSFCTTWHVRPSFMAYGMETLEKHLQFYKKKGVKTIIIMDDSFLNPLKLPGVPSEDAIKHILAVMRKINSQGFKVEFGNGLELRLLWKYWKELHRALFRNCFRLYMPLEDLAYSEKEKPAFEKLMAFEKETDLMRKIIAMRKKGFPLRQLTFGIIVGKPSDSEEGLKRTIERAKIVKETFRGSEIEIALTPYLNSLLPGTIDFAKYNEKLSLKDINRDPELLCYSMVSNRTEHIKDTKKVWGAWLAIMNLNPAKNYLENFRKNGEVILAKVEK